MVQRRLRSRSKRKVYVKTPGSKTVVHYRERKPDKQKCGKCGSPLHGIPRLLQSKLKNIAKTKKRPERPFGGVLCSKCMRKKIIEGLMKND